MADPTRPSDIPFGLTLAELAQRQAEHCTALFDHHYGFREPLTGAERRGHALAELAYGAALVTRARAGQWVVVCEALDTGATHDQVGAALGLDAEALRAELAGWAVGQHRQGRIDDARLAEVLALAEADPGAEVASETNDEPAAGEPGRACLWCGTLPAPHVVLGDPLCAGCYADHRAEVDRGAES